MSHVDDVLDKSRRTLEEAEHLFAGGYYDGCVSRAYYAMFHAAQALLHSEGFEPHTHKGVRTLLGQHFVRTGRLPSDRGRALRNAFDVRQRADYHGSGAGQEEAHAILHEAGQFVREVERLLE